MRTGFIPFHLIRQRQPDPQIRNLALGTWNVTLLGEKENGNVQEVEQYWLENSQTYFHTEPGVFTLFTVERPTGRDGEGGAVCLSLPR